MSRYEQLKALLCKTNLKPANSARRLMEIRKKINLAFDRDELTQDQWQELLARRDRIYEEIGND